MMKADNFTIDQIPAVLYGETAERSYLFLHGQMGCKEEAESFAQIAVPKGYQVLSVDLPGHGARPKQETLTPWAVLPELQSVISWAKSRWNSVSLRANSIGAYFAMLAFAAPARALLVSPILDMEHLILSRMKQARVTEAQLEAQGEIAAGFGPPLSWQYLCWVREHPIQPWTCPICVLCGSRDEMTPLPLTESYARRQHAQLTVMENGEHWFHTPEQLAALRAWEETSA